MKKLWNNLLDLFFPPLCLICESRLINQEEHICIECLNHIPQTNYHLQSNNRLEDFFAGRFPFQRITAYAYFVKGGSIQKLIHKLKYNHNPRLGQYIGVLCGYNLKNSTFISDIDYLIPVPLHKKRQQKRGYNQSLEICKGISAITQIPIESSVLIRTINNKSQTNYKRLKRWQNVENIFQLTNTSTFANKHIALVDDVITTGSTIEACAKTILTCQNTKISIICIGTAH